MNIVKVIARIVQTEEYTGIVLIDNLAKDVMGETRIITPCEMEEFKRIINKRREDESESHRMAVA